MQAPETVKYLENSELAERTGFAFRSPVTGRTKRRQNAREGRRNRAMLNGRVFTKRADIETYSEATHEKAGWDDFPSFLHCAGDAGLRNSKRVRALLWVWVPFGRGIHTAECDECGKRAGDAIE